jgi:hypothetical protein
VGQAEDEIRIDAADALGAIDGLEVRRVFSGWGFYRHGLLFAAMLGRPDELVEAARKVLETLQREPAARKQAGQGRGRAAPAGSRTLRSEHRHD